MTQVPTCGGKQSADLRRFGQRSDTLAATLYALELHQLRDAERAQREQVRGQHVLRDGESICIHDSLACQTMDTSMGFEMP